MLEGWAESREIREPSTMLSVTLDVFGFFYLTCRQQETWTMETRLASYTTMLSFRFLDSG